MNSASGMQWISIFKCPVTGSALRMIEEKELRQINAKIAADKLWQADGSPMKHLLEKALSNEDGSFVYPVAEGIVLLLKELAVVHSIDKAVQININTDKQKVKDFYDYKGWVTDSKGNYEDAVLYEDLREVSSSYLKKCHDRVSRYLNASGNYMLDAASGALQFDDYLQYSANYNYRVCVDFSFKALTEAKRKLGARGIYVLCDMTNMPFKDGVMGGFVSLNTIYHIPKDEQVLAIKELYRVLAPGCRGIVVYDWYKHSSWMNFWMFPFRAFVFMKNRLLDGMAKLSGGKGAERKLYFYSHPPKYFKQNLPPYQLKVWRSLSVHFMRYYIHSWMFGKQILNWVYKMEEKHPERCGLKGEYPLMVFEKKSESPEIWKMIPPFPKAW